MAGLAIWEGRLRDATIAGIIAGLRLAEPAQIAGTCQAAAASMMRATRRGTCRRAAAAAESGRLAQPRSPQAAAGTARSTEACAAMSSSYSARVTNLPLMRGRLSADDLRAGKATRRSPLLRWAARRAASRARCAAAAASFARRASSASAAAAALGAAGLRSGAGALGCAAALSEASRSAVEGMAAAAAASAGPHIWKGCTPPMPCHATCTLLRSSCSRRPVGPSGSGAGACACTGQHTRAI